MNKEQLKNKYNKDEMADLILNKEGRYDEDIVSMIMKMKKVFSIKGKKDNFKISNVYKAIELYNDLMNEDSDVIIDTYRRCREFVESITIGYKIKEDEFKNGFLDLYINAYLFSYGTIK